MKYPLGRGINFQMFVTQVDPILLSLARAKYPLMKAPWNSWPRPRARPLLELWSLKKSFETKDFDSADRSLVGLKVAELVGEAE